MVDIVYFSTRWRSVEMTREIPGQARNEEWKGPVLRQAQQPAQGPARMTAQLT